MLLFDDSKKLEKALGEEAAAVIAHVFEKVDKKWHQELATKADVMAVKSDLSDMEKRILTATSKDLEIGLAKTKHDILRWMVGGFIAQTALLVAILAFLR